ncbi:MAG: sigma-70 family RNA polymerase sigma factor [Nevskiaceae bacterium]|jgi:RNA polymerase sigma-70 factor (ECF subfamily)|nr:sigma-70 family RNA polymerase sigma factor [Nevskiaceae bacterium]
MDRHTRETQFHALLTANLPALRRLAASYAGRMAEQEDLVQDIALALWQALPRFRGESSSRTFLFRIAHNRCLSYLSRRRINDSLDELELDPADPMASPEQTLDNQQASQRLLQAVHRLPLNHRQVVVLALEDLDYQEIAAVLGISENNVGVRLNRARAQLRIALGEDP